MFALAPTSARRRAARVLALALALGAWCSGCQNHKSVDPPQVFAGISLVDQHASPLAAEQLSGRVLVVSFMFTSCPSVCPRQTEALVAVRRALPPPVRERVRFLSVSVDPDNDSPLALADFARSHGADVDGWSFVRSDAAGTALLGSRLAVFDRRAEPSPGGHGTAIYLFDRGGRLVQRYRGAPVEVAHLARELIALDDLKPSGARLASN